MKFSCDGASLSKALRTACSVIKSRNAVPVLECVKIEAQGEQVTVSSTDLDIFVSVDIEASVTEPGVAVAGGSVVRGLVRSGHAAFETEGDVLVFRGASSSARLNTHEPNTFPIFKEAEQANPIKSPVQDILACMAFASDDETRWYICGVCVDESHIVATDGHRCLIIEGGGGQGQIMPRMAEPLLRMIPEADISLGESLWFAETPTVRACGKLIDGTFPDWRSVSPLIDYTATALADEVKSAAASLSPVFSERVRALVIEQDETAMTLSAQGGFGSGRAIVPLLGQIGRCAINGKYLEGVCAAFDGQEVEIGTSNDMLQFRANGRRAVVMGMRA